MATLPLAPRLVVGTLVLASALVIGGCTGDPGPSQTSATSSGSGSSSGSSSSPPAADTVRGAADKVLGFAAAKPVATQTGTVMASDKRKVPAQAEVASLTRGRARPFSSCASPRRRRSARPAASSATTRSARASTA